VAEPAQPVVDSLSDSGLERSVYYPSDPLVREYLRGAASPASSMYSEDWRVSG
jgi:hypothetical protein